MTELARIAVLVSALGCTLIAVAVTLHPRYHCGLVRTIGLGMIAVAGLSRSSTLLFEPDGTVTHIGVLLWVGLLLFLGSHAWRFYSRYAQRGPCWYESPEARDGDPTRP